MKENRSGAGAPRKDNRLLTGRLGEDAAAAYLAGLGCELLHRNWRCRSGELDIVARTDGTIVFVEVRTRRSAGRFGTAAESVDWRKQMQVRATAQYYLHVFGLEQAPVRFDVIAVSLNGASASAAELNHIQGAF